MSRTIGFIYAHPDDETFLSACLIRQLADGGENPILLLATKGDAGKKNGPMAHLSNEELAVKRQQEMDRAAKILGLKVVEYLGFSDGKLSFADEHDFLEGVIGFIHKYNPEVVVTFPPDGGNGHPDHVAISRVTTKAVTTGRCPSVQKLYYTRSNGLIEKGYQPSCVIDTEPQWEMKASALRAHESQIFAIHRYFGDLTAFPEDRRYESFILGWEKGVFWPSPKNNDGKKTIL
jgi:LmbE family N-acetylglucosaminyl deacetylase